MDSHNLRTSIFPPHHLVDGAATIEILERQARRLRMMSQARPYPVPVDVKLLDPKARMPEYAHGTDSGFDIFSVVNQEIGINEVAKISTGIAIQAPEDFDFQLYDRSGLAAKGIHVLGGVIDAGYTGELKVVIANLGWELRLIEEGDKICQVRIHPRYKADFRQVEELVERDRGANGFGSTGLKASGESVQ